MSLNSSFTWTLYKGPKLNLSINYIKAAPIREVIKNLALNFFCKMFTVYNEELMNLPDVWHCN